MTLGDCFDVTAGPHLALNSRELGNRSKGKTQNQCMSDEQQPIQMFLVERNVTRAAGRTPNGRQQTEFEISLNSLAIES